MKPRQRQAAILEHLQKQGKCSVEELAHYFDTTGTTIRKDLVLLENSGAVIRTYGGVMLNKDEADPPIDHKTLINTHHESADCRSCREVYPRWRLYHPGCRQHGVADDPDAQPL